MDHTDGIIQLPQAFTVRMEHMLQEEYPVFLQAYGEERSFGLRLNPLKTERDEFIKRMPFALEPVPWTAEGFYYQAQEQPGKHAFHEAGVYYIQEPSAMAPVEALAPMPGERVLDLCAAPGGKSTQIAGKMCGCGLLVANEIIPGRAKILSQNIERMGISNAVVCNEAPERLAGMFPSFFDRVLVDAPCSGEGMFRKDETAVKEWSPEHVRMCAERQDMVLEQAAQMLRPGGILVYSTCTFSTQENEGVMAAFLKSHPDFSIETSQLERFFEPGRPDWVAEEGQALEGQVEDLVHTMRLWPHRITGEGHYIARLKKEDGLYRQPPVTVKRENGDAVRICKDFLREELGMKEAVLEKLEANGNFMLFGEHIYVMPRQMIPLKGIKALRPGLHVGTMKKNRFEPSHALALFLSLGDAEKIYELTEEQAAQYLRGEMLGCEDSYKGWMLLAFQGYSLGFGKAGGGKMKNHYPKGLRK